MILRSNLPCFFYNPKNRRLVFFNPTTTFLWSFWTARLSQAADIMENGELHGWSSYFTSVWIPSALELLQYAAYPRGNKATARALMIISTLHSVSQVVSGFSVNPGNLGNPITRMDQLKEISLPRHQNDETFFGVKPNGTDLLLVLCAKQINKERKHYLGVASGKHGRRYGSFSIKPYYGSKHPTV